ncbi:MAG TPA: FUSC family protein [Polyangia bacterium]|nr:FUSC family protein [Polyangia bacterium]
MVKGTLAFDWARAQPRAALLCLPAVALPLLVGMMVARPIAGLMVAAGAFSVGFGSFQELRGSRRLPMLVAAATICLSSWIGTIAGASAPMVLLLSALWGAAYGLAGAAGAAAAWLALQCLIWLVISMSYPSHGVAALVRGSCALGGGLLQMLVVWTGWWSTGNVPAPVSFGPIAGGPEYRWRAIHTATVLVVSMALARTIPFGNSYWIPMTAAIVTRPELRQTVERGLARTAGTLAGAAIATLVAWALHPHGAAVSGLVLVFAGLAYLMLFVNYATFAACVTAYVVFLLTLAGGAQESLVAHRIASTVLGAALAWIGHAMFAGIERAAAAQAASEDANRP